MNVRPARLEDLDAIHAIATASPTAPHWTPAQFEAALAAPSGSVVERAMPVAEDGAVAGFAVVSALSALYPVEAELESIAVHPDSRRRGTGSALLRNVFDWCSEKAVGTLRLEVRASNANAISLYERFGFRRDGTRSRYYASPAEDAICMSCVTFPTGSPSPSE